MPDLNQEALAMWNAMKPIIDKEIERRTAGMVQRRKAVVSTAPASGVIGVKESFSTEIFIPYSSALSSATVGTPVWIEFAYGMNNAVAVPLIP